ncbi:MAG: ATP synthase F1 subunit delta [bacterium]|nr:MAG: hypothetical protein DIU52_12280 [bacterium]
MRETTVARSYAEALFELGRRHDQLETYADALDVVTGLLETEPAIRTFLESPTVEPAAKKGVLTDALGNRVPRPFLNFMLVVIDKGRQRLLPEIAREYHDLLDEHLGRLHVQVTLAREPDARMREEIKAALSTALGRTVVPHFRADPRIIGGMVVRYGDRVLDGSLRSRLNALRRQLLSAELPRTLLV